MSTFPGRMKEYRLVSIDRFDADNLLSTVYFLSHKHSDHMQGLADKNFIYRLHSNNHIKLYCSPITRSLLILDHRYKHLQKYIVDKEVDVPWVLEVPHQLSGKTSYKLTVTMLPAAHCPGSVMFLFEGAEGTVLYTGDFRLSKQDIAGMINLHSGSRPKPIQSMYVDTTFCVPQAHYIPSREESVAAVIELVENWLNRGSGFHVVLRYMASLGYEQLLMEISRHFNQPIHVGKSVYQQYKSVGDLADFTTADPSLTRIHACKTRRRQVGVGRHLPCGYLPPNGARLKVRNISVATMCFIQRVANTRYLKKWSDTSFKVCYSFHSSYSEIHDIVHYLKPLHAFPNVVAQGQTHSQMQKRLDKFVEAAAASGLRVSQKYRRLGRIRSTEHQKRQLSTGDSEEFDFGESGFTPEKKKKKHDSLHSTPDSQKFPHLFGPATECVDEACGSCEEGCVSENSDSQRTSAEDVDCEWMLEEDEVELKLFASPDEVGNLYGPHCSRVFEEYEDEESLDNFVCPDGDDDYPGGDDDCPDGDDECPDGDNDCPDGDNDCPDGDNDCHDDHPGGDDDCPDGDDDCPGGDDDCPGGDDDCPKCDDDVPNFENSNNIHVKSKDKVNTSVNQAVECGLSIVSTHETSPLGQAKMSITISAHSATGSSCALDDDQNLLKPIDAREAACVNGLLSHRHPVELTNEDKHVILLDDSDSLDDSQETRDFELGAGEFDIVSPSAPSTGIGQVSNHDHILTSTSVSCMTTVGHQSETCLQESRVTTEVVDLTEESDDTSSCGSSDVESLSGSSVSSSESILGDNSICMMTDMCSDRACNSQRIDPRVCTAKPTQHYKTGKCETACSGAKMNPGSQTAAHHDSGSPFLPQCMGENISGMSDGDLFSEDSDIEEIQRDVADIVGEDILSLHSEL